jgi:macrolide-specific efflux system membrane fusion protein
VRIPPKWRAIGGVVFGAAVTLLLVSQSAGTTASAPVPPHAAAGTVRVVRQDVTEVVALQATVVATPTFTVAATRRGTLRQSATARPGTRLSGGQGLGSVDAEVVRTPVPGTFRRWLVPQGATIVPGLPIAEVTYAGFGEVADLPPADAYRILSGRLTARADVTDGPGPFDCPILQAPSGARSAGDDHGPTVICAIPLGVRVFDGLAGTVAVASGQAHDVPVLPTTAVSGTVQQGEVTLVEPDGRTRRRQVRLGVTDGSVVEIVAGLREGDTVLERAPTLLDAP